MKHGTPDTWIVNSSSGGDGKWAGGEDGQELIELAPSDMTSCGITTSSISRHNVTSVISLPSIGLACPVHRLHLKLISGFREPEIPLYFLCIQLEQPTQEMEFVPMALRHMPQGPLPDFWSTSSPSFAHVDPKSFSFYVGLSEDQLLLQFLQPFSDDDQVICIQAFAGTPSCF